MLNVRVYSLLLSSSPSINLKEEEEEEEKKKNKKKLLILSDEMVSIGFSRSAQTGIPMISLFRTEQKLRYRTLYFFLTYLTKIYR